MKIASDNGASGHTIHVELNQYQYQYNFIGMLSNNDTCGEKVCTGKFKVTQIKARKFGEEVCSH